MWPMLLDYSRDECKRILRRLELEAYSSVVSAFRAQGELSKEKKKIMMDLQQMLSISIERHRAEVRRAVSDERLTTVADSTCGSTTLSEWLIEGRRLVPLLPRLVPQTAFTQTANQTASIVAEKNAQLLNPAMTGNKEFANQTSTLTSSGATPGPKQMRASSPTSNVVVLPSGTSIHIKGMLNQDEDEEYSDRRQRRSLSMDGLGAATVSTQTQTARVTCASASTVGSTSPVKITISKSPQGRTIVSQPGGQPPKVILVTSSGQSAGSSAFQRSMSVPVIRASTSTSTSQTGATRTSIIIPGSPGLGASNGSMGGVVTVTTTSITTSSSATVTMPTSVVGTQPVFSPSINIGKPRPKVVPRQRFPQPQSKPGVVIPMGPMGPQPVPPSPQSIHNIQVKTLPKPPPIHIKQEGGMKIITQSVVGGSSKILPKPAQMAGSQGTPVVVVNAGPSASAGSSTTVTMMPKTLGSYTTTSGSKVLNITTPGGRVIATTGKASNVVTVNPKTLHLTAVKSAAGGTTVSKPNVIVVQKTQARRPQLPTQLPKGGTTVITNPAAFEKELANFIQKESGRQVSVSISPSGAVSSLSGIGGRIPERRVIITTAGSSDPSKQISLQKPVTDAEGRTSSLLAELIQAAGIIPEGVSETTGGVVGNEWFEYDVTEEIGQSVTSDPTDANAMHAVVGLQNSGSKIVQRNNSSDDQSTTAVQEQFYTIEQAMSIINQSNRTPVISLERDITPPSQLHTVIGSSLGAVRTATVTTSGLPGGSARRNEAGVVSATGGILTELESGDLDPQTGLFYSMLPPSQRPLCTVRGKNVSHVVRTLLPQRSGQSQQMVISEGALGRSASQQISTQPMDLLSSSLAQAQIDLGSFDFGDETIETYVPSASDNHSAGQVVVAGTDSAGEEQAPAPVEVVDFASVLLREMDSDATTGVVVQSQAAEKVVPEPGTASADAITSEAGIAAVTTVSEYSSAVQQTSLLTLSSTPELWNRSSGFIPLENVRDLHSSGISLVTHEEGVHLSASENLLPGSNINSSSSLVSSVPTASIPCSSSPPSPLSSSLLSSSSSAVVSQTFNTQPPSLGVAVSMPVVSATTTSNPVVSGSSTRIIDFVENTSPSASSLQRSVTGMKSVTVTIGGISQMIQNDQATGLSANVDRASVNSDRERTVVNASFERTCVGVDGLQVQESSSSAATLPAVGGEFSSLEEEETNLFSSADAADGTNDGMMMDPGNSLRHSKRKRKPPSALEEAAIGSAGGSWIRTASSILMKVCRYRGTNREKGELNASAWFTQPVDTSDAPDYYTIIKNPMDFGTIKKKLEGGQYGQFEDFHSDMLLVKSNCFMYNPPNTRVYRDCVQVFNFFQQEIDRLLDKSTSKMQVGSPGKKLVRLDKSPNKS